MASFTELSAALSIALAILADDNLVSKKPTTKEELIKIQGFGQVKVEKYGEDILEVILKNS